MVKVVFFDVDGTLISNSQNAVPESTRTALNQLSEKGIQRVIATGRHMLELSLLPVSNIHFDAYITLNGQLCLDAQGNTLFGNPITGKSKEYIIRMFHEKTVPIMIVEKENMYINFVNQNVQVAQDAISTPVPNVGEYTGNEIFQAIAYLEKGREETIAGQMPGCKVTRWNDFAVDIIAASGGKRVGIILIYSIQQSVDTLINALYVLNNFFFDMLWSKDRKGESFYGSEKNRCIYCTV